MIDLHAKLKSSVNCISLTFFSILTVVWVRSLLSTLFSMDMSLISSVFLPLDSPFRRKLESASVLDTNSSQNSSGEN